MTPIGWLKGPHFLSLSVLYLLANEKSRELGGKGFVGK